MEHTTCSKPPTRYDFISPSISSEWLNHVESELLPKDSNLILFQRLLHDAQSLLETGHALWSNETCSAEFESTSLPATQVHVTSFFSTNIFFRKLHLSPKISARYPKFLLFKNLPRPVCLVPQRSRRRKHAAAMSQRAAGSTRPISPALARAEASPSDWWLRWLSHSLKKTTCSSGNQTWQWKIHHLVWWLSLQITIYSGFPIATLDYQRLLFTFSNWHLEFRSQWDEVLAGAWKNTITIEFVR